MTKKISIELTDRQINDIRNLLHDGATLSTVSNVPESAMALNPPNNKSRYDYALDIISKFEISAGKANINKL